MRRSWLAVLVTAALFVTLNWTLAQRRGLTRSAAEDAAPRAEFTSRTVSDLGLQDIDPGILNRPDVTLIWRAVWSVPSSDLFVLGLAGRGWSSWSIDGHLANENAGVDGSPVTRAVWLAAGFHWIEIRYRPDAAEKGLAASVGRVNHAPEPIASQTLKPDPPRNPRIRRATEILRQALGWLLVVLLVLAVRKTLMVLPDRWRGRIITSAWVSSPSGSGRWLAWVVLAFILTYGALLRLDAITLRYGPVTSPAWLAALQTRTVLPPLSIRNDWFPWLPPPLHPHPDGPPTRYRSDPYTYLKYARAMQSFYDPQNEREPVFPFAVKGMLALLRNQDVAVSFTSAVFALLACWATYLLGAAFWSRPVGLAAALGLAMDRDAVWFSSQGWRDDAYVAAVAVGAYLILRTWRSVRGPTRIVRLAGMDVDRAYLEAVLLGAAAGLIVLVRFMAFSFLLPAGVVVVAAIRGGVDRRLRIGTLGVATAILVAAPYFINCWRAFGDPFYTWNYHANVYRGAEGKSQSDQGTVAYIRDKIAARPFLNVDTVARGLSVFPFSNKWEGLDGWRQGLGRIVAAAAIAGLIVSVFTPAGRLILFVALTSLLPFSFTWRVDPNWRFTAHLYPFLLIAAAVAVSVAVSVIRRVVLPGMRSRPSPWLRDRTGAGTGNLLMGTSTVLSALLVLWLVTRVSPHHVFAEALRVGEEASVVSGADDVFFGRGWSNVLTEGNVRLRVCLDEGDLALRLPEVRDYGVLLRIDPFPRPSAHAPAHLPIVEYELNGAALGTIALSWNPDRVGDYEITLPKAHVRSGRNRLVLRLKAAAGAPARAIARPGLAEGQAFGLWQLRVSPR